MSPSLHLDPSTHHPGTILLWPAHPLLLAGHKGLEPWGHTKAQLVDERRFILTVDLHFDASFEGRLVYENEEGGVGRASDSLTASRAGDILPLLGINTAYTGTGGICLWDPSPSLASFRVHQTPAALTTPASCTSVFLPSFGHASWCFKFSLTVSDAFHCSLSFSPFSPISLCPKAPETRQTEAAQEERELFIERVAATDGKRWLVTLESD